MSGDLFDRSRPERAENLFACQNAGVFGFPAFDLGNRVKRHARRQRKSLDFCPRERIKLVFEGDQDVHTA